MSILDKDFLSKLKKDYQIDNQLIESILPIAKLPYQEFTMEELPFESSILMIQDILSKIDISYLRIFNQMLNEEDPDKPIIYIYDSNNSLDENESLTYRHEIHFYKTNTTADIYLLLHEFSHYLINRNNAYSYNKSNNEIVPMLMEYIISLELNNQEYIKHRLNDIIFQAKSLVIKSNILKGNYNLDSLYQEYNFTEKDIKRFETDLLYSKSLKYDEEISYIKGFIYASYYANLDPITNYLKLVEQLNISREINLPTISINDIIINIYNKKRSASTK